MTQFSMKKSFARIVVLAAALLLMAGPAAPQAMACGGEGEEAEPLLINGELPGGG